MQKIVDLFLLALAHGVFDPLVLKLWIGRPVVFLLWQADHAHKQGDGKVGFYLKGFKPFMKAFFQALMKC